ncbi:hypothetical protein NDI37_13495 [Funiculus sociatus GB2-A5]|uniref:Uncharacterized protein n=1 Tax=Funiculus sociatus GB2-A5 TaxID=2933946 RepID=A0ABV0JPR8_9CYAN|nr:hypothetical protein [Trichocoleus sp. FACHB-6]
MKQAGESSFSAVILVLRQSHPVMNLTPRLKKADWCKFLMARSQPPLL